MHAVEMVDSSVLLAIIVGLILFVIVFTLIFRKKR
jgi:LPXTG-motif cell wall-anchored protein